MVYSPGNCQSHWWPAKKEKVIHPVKFFKILYNRLMYYTYILLSEKDGKYYTGYTKNLKERFKIHKNGRNISTVNRRPLKLIYYEACINRSDATHREKYLKTYYGKMFLKNRLKSYFTG